MKRKEIRAALMFTRKLAKSLEAMLGVPERAQNVMRPDVAEKVRARICLLCGQHFPKPQPYQRGRCGPHYRQFYYESKQDSGLEARLIEEGTLAPEQAGGRHRQEIPKSLDESPAAKQIAEAKTPEDRKAAEEAFDNLADDILDDMDHRRKANKRKRGH